MLLCWCSFSSPKPLTKRLKRAPSHLVSLQFGDAKEAILHLFGITRQVHFGHPLLLALPYRAPNTHFVRFSLAYQLVFVLKHH